jgi:hypothetical protein
MPFPCDNKVLCPDDEALANLTSESLDGPTFVRVINGVITPPLGSNWDQTGCLGVCVSLVSQEDADLCALRQQAFCNGTEVFLNAAQSCTVNCPDGTPFTYTVPAGTFTAPFQEEADAVARSYACQQANLNRICLSPAQCQVCVGELSTIGFFAAGAIDEPTQMLWQIVAGQVPTGMVFAVDSQGVPRLVGIPTESGQFIFTLRVTATNGNFMQKSYSVYSIEIVDGTLPDFEVGVAYSHQLTVDGGSGDFLWRISEGSLPAGLSLSNDGLISGTPTSAASSTFSVEVVDLACEAADKSFYPPAVSLTTLSTTRIATLLGFSEYQGFASTPPKKYRTLTFSGYSKSGYRTFGSSGTVFLGAGRYDWSGLSQYDLGGALTSEYEKVLKTACQSSPNGPGVLIQGSSPQLRGYCGPWFGVNNGELFSKTCDSCPNPDVYVDEIGWKSWPGFATNSPYDGSDLFGAFPGGGSALTPSSATQAGVHTAGVASFSFQASPIANVAFPSGSGPGSSLIIDFDHQFDAVLSDEYTDAQALAQSVVITGIGRVAESRPRTTGFQSRWTSVAFVLNFTQLLAGENYVASVRFVNDNGVETVQNYAFTAEDIVHTINGTIPTPPDGTFLEIRNPTVAYA